MQIIKALKQSPSERRNNEHRTRARPINHYTLDSFLKIRLQLIKSKARDLISFLESIDEYFVINGEESCR